MEIPGWDCFGLVLVAWVVVVTLESLSSSFVETVSTATEPSRAPPREQPSKKEPSAVERSRQRGNQDY